MIKRSTIKAIAGELAILVGLALLAAVVFNFFNPKGIRLWAGWGRSECAEIPSSSSTAAIIYGFEVGSISQARQIFDSGQALFVDSRAIDYYANGHIKRAVSLPLGQFEERIESFKRQYPLSTEIVTYCYAQGCNDSYELALKLMAQGYARVSHFPGGFLGWERAGYPIE